MTEPRAPANRPKLNRWYIIGGIVAVGIGYYFYKKSAAPATTPTDQTGLDQSGGYGGYYPPGAPSAYQTSLVQAPADVAAWTNDAASILQNQGIDTTYLFSGVANWVYGPNRLSDPEYNAVESAIGALGMPPGVSKIPARAQTNQSTSTRLPQPQMSSTGGGGIGRKVTLHWTNVPGATRYFLYRNGMPIATVKGTNYSYTERTRHVSWAVEAWAAGKFRSLRSNPVVVP